MSIKKAPLKNLKEASYLADLIFDPTLACWNFRFGFAALLTLSILLSAGLTSKPRHAHIFIIFCNAYVDPFARDWLGLSTTDLNTFLV